MEITAVRALPHPANPKETTTVRALPHSAEPKNITAIRAHSHPAKPKAIAVKRAFFHLVLPKTIAIERALRRLATSQIVTTTATGTITTSTRELAPIAIAYALRNQYCMNYMNLFLVCIQTGFYFLYMYMYTTCRVALKICFTIFHSLPSADGRSLRLSRNSIEILARENKRSTRSELTRPSSLSKKTNLTTFGT